MSLSVIRVSFSRQANDGDYGSETARCEFEYTVADDDDVHNLPSMLLAGARAHVHAELSKSPNWKVRRAIEEPKPLEPTTWTPDEDLPL